MTPRPQKLQYFCEVLYALFILSISHDSTYEDQREPSLTIALYVYKPCIGPLPRIQIYCNEQGPVTATG